MTVTDLGRKFGRAVMARSDRYKAHPFAITFRLLGFLLIPNLIWLLITAGLLWLVSTWGIPIPADPVKASNDALVWGLLLGGSAAVGTCAVLYLLYRKQGPK
jgi:hypothetical protein